MMRDAWEAAVRGGGEGRNCIISALLSLEAESSAECCETTESIRMTHFVRTEDYTKAGAALLQAEAFRVLQGKLHALL